MINERRISQTNRKNAKSWQVTLPDNYPWKVLSATLADVRQLKPEYQFAELDEIIRARDLSKYLEWGKQWSLQSMSNGN